MENDSLLRILAETESLLSIQKLCLQLAGTSFTNGDYVFVTVSSSAKFLCQIHHKALMHPQFCNFDSSVQCFEELLEPFHLQCTEKFDFISVKAIQIVHSVKPIKSLFVSLIFDSAWATSKWRCKSEILVELVKDLLQLFVVANNSVISLKNLKQCQKFSLYCIVVHTIGKRTAGKIVASSKVILHNVISRQRFNIQYNKPYLPPLGGVELPYRFLKQLISITCDQRVVSTGKKQPRLCRQVLIMGPSGCGKTALVRQVAYDCHAPLVTVLGPELSRPQPGETERALSEKFEEARLLADEQPKGVCVLLLDQVDSLCVRRGIEAKSHLVRCTTQLLRLLDQVEGLPRLIVMATTDRPHALDLAIRRPGRLEAELYIGVPSENERCAIMSARWPSISPVVCQLVAQSTPGYIGADLALLVQDVLRDLSKVDSLQRLNDCDVRGEEMQLKSFRRCLARLRPSMLRGQLGVVVSCGPKMEDLGGVEAAKQALRQAVEWPLVHADAFRRLGLPRPTGVLLYGPPGCAKTSLARAVAGDTNTTFLAISAAELYSPYVGDAERTVSQLFHRARLGAPAILFIDEIDALVGSRGNHGDSGVRDRILSTFLTEMDGIGIHIEAESVTSKLLLEEGVSRSEPTAPGGATTEEANNTGVIVIAATNRPDKLDSALLRSGRFDKHLFIGPPTQADRLDILRTLTKRMPLADCVDLEALAEVTHLYSGADLASLCKEAALHALSEDGMLVEQIRHGHWLAATKNLRPSLTQEQIEWYDTFRMANNMVCIKH